MELIMILNKNQKYFQARDLQTDANDKNAVL